jgi:methylmalonyl-CoA mutase
MSAVLGGADSISIAPLDECCKRPDESSRRLARNTQIILKREALLDRVADPVGGSYLIEVLTNSIATKAWKLFQELEDAGGYRKARAASILSSVLDRRVKAREEAIAGRKRVLTGTNRFANVTEKVADWADVAWMDAMPRVARRFEQLRLRTERYEALNGRSPLIVLAEIGDARMRSARSQFAADFLACAGLASEVRRFDRPEEIGGSDADLIVLCSSDPEYLSIAQELMPVLREQESRSKVVVAGDPETADQLKNLGVVEFIHLRSNAIAVLTTLLQQIGVKE